MWCQESTATAILLNWQASAVKQKKPVSHPQAGNRALLFARTHPQRTWEQLALPQ